MKINKSNKISKKAAPGEKKPRVGVTAIRSIPNITKLLPVIAIIVTYVVIFFFLRGKVLFTPDFDQSDAFHLYVSTKQFLWQTLQQNKLPFWTQQLQGGFPLLAEGQTGTLYLPNLILYRFFSFPDAYMLSFTFSLFVFAIGFYLLLVQSRVRPIIATLIGISASFSGFISFRWVHFSILQGTSLIPLLMVLATIVWQKKANLKHKLLLSFVIGQFFCTGHPQIGFIGVLSMFVWYIAHNITQEDTRKEIINGILIYIIPTLLLGFIFALPQLLPSIEFMFFSTRTQQAGYAFATSYSYSFSQLFSFITPFFYGNPKYHTFPFDLSVWGVFWENTPYIGEVLFCLIVISVITVLFIRRKINKQIILLLSLSVLFMILSLGSNSPFYFIYDIPPFSLFRTPARFLIPSSIFLLWAGAVAIDVSLQNTPRLTRYAVYALLMLNICLLLYTAFTYHVFIDVQKILTRKSVAQPLDEDERYITLGFRELWGGYFNTHGWETKKDIQKYLQFNSSIIPQSNFMYGGECTDVNTGGLRLRRVDILNSLLTNYFATESSKTSTSAAQNLMSLLSIRTVVSTVSLPQLKKTEFTESQPHTLLYQYKNKSNNSIVFYTPKVVRNITLQDEFYDLFYENRISTQEAVIEGYRTEYFLTSPLVRVIHNDAERFQARVSAEKKSIVAIAKNWYPGWELKLDGKRITPIKTNLVHMGVIIPPGKHTISLHFQPVSFYWGVGFAGVAYFGSFFIILLNFTKDRK